MPFPHVVARFIDWQTRGEASPLAGQCDGPYRPLVLAERRA
jgi:hypothetical protein